MDIASTSLNLMPLLEDQTRDYNMGRKACSPRAVLPFRFPGGKYYALRKLRPFWETIDHDEYREPFLGGGAVFWAKSKVHYNWLNDLDNDLIFVLEFISKKENRDTLTELFHNEEEPSRDRHSLVKNMTPTNDLECVYRYYYLNRTSFSGKMKNPTWGYRPKRSLPPRRWKERIIPCGEKLEGVKLTSLDFQQVITAPAMGKNVLMYLDPPYYHSKQENHYSFAFTEYDHVRLCTLLKTTPYYFFLTYDDCPEVRKLYEWAYVYQLSFFYRIDNSRDSENTRKTGNELIITNYLLNTKKTPKQLTFSFMKTPNNRNGSETRLPKSKVKWPIIENIRSPIRFPGSKYQALKFIAPFWDCIGHDEYREPFLGGGAVFFAKPLAAINWINDIDKELIFTFKCMADREKRGALKKMIAKVQPSKDFFDKLKYSDPKDELDIVFRYFVINRTAYSGIMHKPNWGYHTTKSVHPYKWPERIEKAGQKLEHAKITNLDYKEVISASPEGKSVFLFVDPPYFKTDQKRAYHHSFGLQDHLELASLLKTTKFKFCLTYDDCTEIRQIYSWANIHEFSWRYHTANANTSTRKMGKELIVTNY